MSPSTREISLGGARNEDPCKRSPSSTFHAFTESARTNFSRIVVYYSVRKETC